MQLVFTYEKSSNYHVHIIDLGEIMRFVTNMVSKGRSDYNLQARNVLQLMYYEYIQISPHIHRELNKKIHQHKGSMLKVMSKLEYFENISWNHDVQ